VKSEGTQARHALEGASAGPTIPKDRGEALHVCCTRGPAWDQWLMPTVLWHLEATGYGGETVRPGLQQGGLMPASV